MTDNMYIEPPLNDGQTAALLTSWCINRAHDKYCQPRLPNYLHRRKYWQARIIRTHYQCAVNKRDLLTCFGTKGRGRGRVRIDNVGYNQFSGIVNSARVCGYITAQRGPGYVRPCVANVRRFLYVCVCVLCAPFFTTPLPSKPPALNKTALLWIAALARYV